MGVRLETKGQGARSRAAGGGSLLESVTVSDLLLLILFNGLLFESWLQRNVSSAFSWLDELCSALLVLLALAVWSKTGRLRRDGHVLPGGTLPAVLLLAVWGLLSTAYAQIQTQAYPLIIDLYTSIKGLITLAAVFVLAREDVGRRYGFVRMAVAECKLLAILMFVGAFVSLFTNIGMSTGKPRYGLRPYNFIFYHPSVVNYVAVGLSAILVAHERRPLPWLFCLLFSMACTLRGKGLGEVALICILMLTIRRQGDGRGVTWWHIVLAAAAVVAVGWGQFDEYYFSADGDVSARQQLTRASIAIARDYFPFGSGLATFGSAVTRDLKYYSPLYYKYGLSSVWGLSPQHPSFLTDTFWPTVLGQFGFIGLVILVIALALLYKAYYARARSMGAGVLTATLILLSYMLIISTSDSAFFGPSCIYLIACLGAVLLRRGENSNSDDAGQNFAGFKALADEG